MYQLNRQNIACVPNDLYDPPPLKTKNTTDVACSKILTVFSLKLASGAFEIKKVTLVFYPLKYAPPPFLLVFLRFFSQPVSTVLC